MKLTDEITTIKGIGEKTASLYHKLNIYTVNDLIQYYPRDYEEWKGILLISELCTDLVQTIRATVITTPQTVHIRRNMSITTVQVRDHSGSCELTYFNMPFMKKALQPGKQYILRGRVVMRKSKLTMEHPKIITEEEYTRNLNKLTPIYSITKGLTSQALSKSVRNALEKMSEEVDYLPENIRQEYQLPGLTKSIYHIHFPENKEQLILSRKRLVFEEFLFFIMSVMSLKEMTQQEIIDSPMMKIDACQVFINKLPYELTNAQKKVCH